MAATAGVTAGAVFGAGAAAFAGVAGFAGACVFVGADILVVVGIATAATGASFIGFAIEAGLAAATDAFGAFATAALLAGMTAGFFAVSFLVPLAAALFAADALARLAAASRSALRAAAAFFSAAITRADFTIVLEAAALRAVVVGLAARDAAGFAEALETAALLRPDAAGLRADADVLVEPARFDVVLAPARVVRSAVCVAVFAWAGLPGRFPFLAGFFAFFLVDIRGTLPNCSAARHAAEPITPQGRGAGPTL